MEFPFSILQATAAPLVMSVHTGDVLFLLGANGTGKSSLLNTIYRPHLRQARRVSAHRQNWFESNDGSMTPAARMDLARNLQSWDSGVDARWREHAPAARAEAAVHDLIAAENRHARAVMAAVKAENTTETAELRLAATPLETLNSLLRLSNVPVELELNETSSLVARRSGGATPYSIAQLSDGEKSALLTSATILTVPSGTLVLIDEPERHLHRSICSPLLELLFKRRPDCAFVVSTHDVELPTDIANSRTILVRDCIYDAQGEVTSWDVDVMAAGVNVPEDVKLDILGGRRTLVFVEGVEGQSLDRPLYSILFPSVSVVAKHNCRDVERAVEGIRYSKELHWMRAFGIVDNDRRGDSEIAQLKAKGVYALPTLSVEAIYYNSEVQQRVARRFVDAAGGSERDKLSKAKADALAAIVPHKGPLCERAVNNAVRQAFFAKLPGKREIAARGCHQVTVDIGQIVSEEETRFDQLVLEQDLDGLGQAFGLRHTPALKAIASALGFRSREDYETAVQKLLLSDESALSEVRSKFVGELAAALFAADETTPGQQPQAGCGSD
jgi:ABC-type cobalamin/Fe3+-siderophores transport system ATPase subunit